MRSFWANDSDGQTDVSRTGTYNENSELRTIVMLDLGYYLDLESSMVSPSVGALLNAVASTYGGVSEVHAYVPAGISSVNNYRVQRAVKMAGISLSSERDNVGVAFAADAVGFSLRCENLILLTGDEAYSSVIRACSQNCKVTLVAPYALTLPWLSALADDHFDPGELLDISYIDEQSAVLTPTTKHLGPSWELASVTGRLRPLSISLFAFISYAMVVLSIPPPRGIFFSDHLLGAFLIILTASHFLPQSWLGGTRLWLQISVCVLVSLIAAAFWLSNSGGAKVLAAAISAVLVFYLLTRYPFGSTQTKLRLRCLAIFSLAAAFAIVTGVVLPKPSSQDLPGTITVLATHPEDVDVSVEFSAAPSVFWCSGVNAAVNVSLKDSAKSGSGVEIVFFDEDTANYDPRPDQLTISSPDASNEFIRPSFSGSAHEEKSFMGGSSWRSPGSCWVRMPYVALTRPDDIRVDIPADYRVVTSAQLYLSEASSTAVAGTGSPSSASGAGFEWACPGTFSRNGYKELSGCSPSLAVERTDRALLASIFVLIAGVLLALASQLAFVAWRLDHPSGGDDSSDYPA